MVGAQPEATSAPSMDATEVRPRLRGWLHLAMTPLVVTGGVLLIVLAPTTAGKIGAAIWLGGGVLLFGTSAAYHLVAWSPATKAALRRWDHANIFIFIAATYTPMALTLLSAESATTLLIVIWSIAAAGLILQVFWPTAPRWLNVASYLLLGWAGLGWLPAFWVSGGPAVPILILLGGLVYSIGAVIYGRKSPNPWPEWFGFHEIFHACTLVAAICHFAAIAICLFS
jgi:hemolysin III